MRNPARGSPLRVRPVRKLFVTPESLWWRVANLVDQYLTESQVCLYE